MANLEFINFHLAREAVYGNIVRWTPDNLARPVEELPQIFWANGEPWHEANHWALAKVITKLGKNTSTVKPLMKHLAAYASWLEFKELDWRHFPIRKSERAIVKFRGYLIEQRNQGILAPSTLAQEWLR